MMQIELTLALLYHLTHNHCPPIPESFIPVCEAAIAATNEGDYERLIDLPDGVSHRVHGKQTRAWEIMEFAHLDGFVDDPEQEYEYGEEN